MLKSVSIFRPLIVLVMLPACLRADVTLAPIFQDHVVLQREQPVPVWGYADPDEKVTVRFLDQIQTTTADADGKWSVKLAPLAARTEPGELVVTGKTEIRVTDVLVGEVWLASGQSNMEFPVYVPDSASFHLDRAQDEVAAANYPLIRELRIEHVVAHQPAASAQGAWRVCSPATVGIFSAVGYFFARDLFRELHVPIGIIHSSWGGTPVESWMSAAALASQPQFSVVTKRWAQTMEDYPARKREFDAAASEWEKAAREAGALNPAARLGFAKTHRRPRAPRGPGDSWTPSGLFNGMIAPLIPAAFRGVIWYQGESNADRAREYRDLFGAMITQWRRDFGREFPFYFVQLASFRAGEDKTHESYAFLREAQAQTLALPGTGMAVTIDIGNPDNIHPGNKQEVGRRLALIAEAKTYGRAIESTGPQYESMKRAGPTKHIKFSHAAGLAARQGALAGFTLAGADRIFHPANARIEGETVVVSSPEVADPKAVRYAWANAPQGNLINGAGLPARPFRSDDW
jgi:sialate O-acetylesterase